MIGFKKMLREKRTKVLAFVILLSVFNYGHFTKSVDVTYVLKQKQDYYEPNCIAESDMLDSAIGWIYPIPKTPDKLPKITTKFIPTIDDGGYGCNFSKNNHCNNEWKSQDWKIVDSSANNFKLLTDTRWQDLPVIFTSNQTKEFGKKIEMPDLIDLGFSVRAPGESEVFLCEGWNPRNYPCYYVHIGKTTFLKKIKGLPVINKTTHLDATTSESEVLLVDEWRNFVLNFDDTGTIRLVEMFSGETMLKFKDTKPLKPLYFFCRSSSPALWKVHQNSFLQTTVEKMTKLGPPLKLHSDKLCVSMYASLCDNCIVEFAFKDFNGSDILRETFHKNEVLWQNVKLVKDGIFDNELQLFVTTSSVNKSDTEGVFWVIDDVRFCHKNEMKVTTLIPNDFIKSEENVNEYISCQAVNMHKWRPEQHVHPILNVFPGVEKYAETTSIKLVWKPYPTPIPALKYLIEYQGADTCEVSSVHNKRVKSNGFIITSEHEAVISNLIPYTLYNITFSYVLHDDKKIFSFNTLPTEVPVESEEPVNVTIKPDVDSVNVYFKTPNCTNRFGPLCYLIEVAGFKQQIDHVTPEINITIPNLKAFTNYTLAINYARKCAELKEGGFCTKKVYSFETKADVASPVENLELYSTDSDSISLRYNLPSVPKGLPKYIQVRYCNVWLLNKCNSEISEIKRCKLWPDKYCVDVNDLLKANKYTFDVGLKNLNTHAFGKETRIEGSTVERVPGKPTNITYRMVGCEKSSHYCHLNISWLHPLEQNATITSFFILLNKTDLNGDKSNITQIYKIPNKTYLPQYHQLIKYIPYSTHYDLLMKSLNYKYESDFTTPVHFRTDDIGDHIDQLPKLIKNTGTMLAFEIPALDDRLNASLLYVVVQDYDKNVLLEKVDFDFNKDDLCNKYGNTWLATIKPLLHNRTQILTIGDNTLSNILHKIYVNKRLNANTRYCITFIAKNEYQGTHHEDVYYEKDVITENVAERLVSTTSSSHLYVLVVLLLLVPVGFVVYKYLFKSKLLNRRGKDDDNIYESLPFEDYNNFANNDTYDKLIHT